MAGKGSRKGPKKEDIFVSVVLVITDQLTGSRDHIQKIAKILERKYLNYEIIVVNSGVSEKEISEVISLLDNTPCIRVLHLSHMTRYDTALFSGIESAIGDFVCTIDPMTDPMDLISDIVKANQSSHTVQGVSTTPIQGLLGMRLGRRLFYWYNRKYIGVNIPINATYFASYSRAAVNSLMASKRSHKHIRHLVRLVGYMPLEFKYTPTQNPSRQRTMRTSVVEALEIAANYSTHPLRFVTWLGFFAGIANILYAMYIVAINLTRDVMEGWTTTSLQLSGMFFILFAIMVILAEYIGRILTESQHEPEYYIVDEQSSTTSIADQSRRNIEK